MFQTVKEALEGRGYTVTVCKTAQEATDYLDKAIDGCSVGFGGSITLQDMGVYERLATHNDVHWHWKNGAQERDNAVLTDVYLTSANGLSEDGQIINIDGGGNRVAATCYGHKKVYFVIGKNKLAPTYEEALWRARNVAAPKNAQRLGMKTPCAASGDKCYDCKSPSRICRALTVLWGPMLGSSAEVVLVEEDLGY